jgi:hypothetical protein
MSNQQRLREILDKGLRQIVLKMDTEVRKNIKFENGKHVIVNPQEWITLSKNGIVTSEKKGIVTAYGTKMDLVLFVNNGKRPDISNVYMTYYTTDGKAHKSGNNIMIYPAGKDKTERNACFNQKVDRRNLNNSSGAATGAKTSTPDNQEPVKTSASF